MFSEAFWSQFWPQFWGGVAATLFIAVLTLVFTYVARTNIFRFVRRMIDEVKNVVHLEEEKLRAEEEKFTEKQ